MPRRRPPAAGRARPATRAGCSAIATGRSLQEAERMLGEWGYPDAARAGHLGRARNLLAQGRPARARRGLCRSNRPTTGTRAPSATRWPGSTASRRTGRGRAAPLQEQLFRRGGRGAADRADAGRGRTAGPRDPQPRQSARHPSRNGGKGAAMAWVAARAVAPPVRRLCGRATAATISTCSMRVRTASWSPITARLLPSGRAPERAIARRPMPAASSRRCDAFARADAARCSRHEERDRLFRPSSGPRPCRARGGDRQRARRPTRP